MFFPIICENKREEFEVKKMLFDTHVHINDEAFKEDLEATMHVRGRPGWKR